MERSDFPQGAEGDKSYQAATEKLIEENTGINKSDLHKVTERLQKDPSFQSLDRSKLNPLVRFLADILSGIGVAFENSGLLK